MRIGAVIFGVAVAFLVIVGIGMAVSILSSTPIEDTYSNQPSAQINSSVALVNNVTAVGQSAGTGLFLVFAAILVISAIIFLLIYGKYK